MLLLVLILFAFAPQEVKSRAGDVAPAADYASALTAILARVVTEDGLVRYDLLGGPLRDDFRRVLKAVEDYDAATLRTDAEKLAFWMNAYNVQMLQHILETPGAADVVAGGHADRFFKTPYRTAGRALTLDAIEHVILRRRPGAPAEEALRVGRPDPRVHVGLNCAARGCPRLRRAAFTPAGVEAELEAAMRDFVNDPRHFRVAQEHVEEGRFVVSSLVDWYGDDFDAAGRPAGDYLAAYLSPSRPGFEALRGLLRGRTAAALRRHPGVRFAYDWTVNRAAP